MVCSYLNKDSEVAKNQELTLKNAQFGDGFRFLQNHWKTEKENPVHHIKDMLEFAEALLPNSKWEEV